MDSRTVRATGFQLKVSCLEPRLARLMVISSGGGKGPV